MHGIVPMIFRVFGLPGSRNEDQRKFAALIVGYDGVSGNVSVPFGEEGKIDPQPIVFVSFPGGHDVEQSFHAFNGIEDSVVNFLTGPCPFEFEKFESFVGKVSRDHREWRNYTAVAFVAFLAEAILVLGEVLSGGAVGFGPLGDCHAGNKQA